MIKVTIEVPDTKISRLLSQLNGFKATCEFVASEAPPPKKKNGRGGRMHSRAESTLTMLDKQPTKGSGLAKAKEIFEKLEARMGIGNVTVQDFRDELVKKKISKQLAQRCVTEGVLAYL